MNDAAGDPRNYDPNDPYWDPYNYDATWSDPSQPVDAPPSAPVAAAPPNIQTPDGVPGNQWGLGPGGSEQYDLWYWLNHGVTPTGNDGSIFDNNGQLRPGWVRTANGYERQSALPQTTTIPTTIGTFGTPTGTSGTGSAPTAGNWPTYNAPGFVDPGTFDPGPAFSYKDFSAPTGEDVLKDPSFQFRLDQGRKALEASAAGKGTLRSGGSLKDLLSYGQNFASQEYGNVFNRALQEYDTNRHNAFDTYNTGYQGRKDQYGFGADRANNLNSFNTNNAQFDFNGRQRQAEQEFQDLYNRWAKQGDWLSTYSTAGL